MVKYWPYVSCSWVTKTLHLCLHCTSLFVWWFYYETCSTYPEFSHFSGFPTLKSELKAAVRQRWSINEPMISQCSFYKRRWDSIWPVRNTEGAAASRSANFLFFYFFYITVMHKVLYDILSFKHFRQWDGKRDSIPVTPAYLKPGRKSGKNTVQDKTWVS